MTSITGDAPEKSGAAFQNQLSWAIRLVWREKLIIAGIVLLAATATLAYLGKATRLYTAQAAVVIDAVEPSDSLTERESARYRLTEANIQTESEVISSTVLARRVIERLNLDQDPEFNLSLRQEPSALGQVIGYVHPRAWFPGWEAGEGNAGQDERLKQQMQETRIVRRFMSKLSVRSIRRSFVVTIQFTSENREKAARIANAVADLYVLERLEASLEQTRRTSAWLGERLQQLRGEVQAAEQAVEIFRAEEGLGRINERSMTVSDQQLTELNSRLILARTELAQKRARLSQVQALQRGRGVDTATDVLQSPLIQRLREQQVTLQRELSEAVKTYGDRHPRLIAIRADLQEFEIKMRQEVNKIATSLENEVVVAQTGVRTLEGELSGTRQRTDVARGAEVQLRQLQREAESSRLLYEAFLGRYKRDAEQERLQQSNA
ncbi:MAG: GumC family protein, partial [Alphaproteobacteria bacterium]|nr:GumC family protein [Alphaproteobacteria bacterium]